MKPEPSIFDLPDEDGDARREAEALADVAAGRVISNHNILAQRVACMLQMFLVVILGGQLAACSDGHFGLSGNHTNEQFDAYVKRGPIGSGADYWIAMRNNFGEWERVGLIFGYYTSDGARIEYENAITGLKRVNYDRVYTCIPANVS